MRCPLFDSELVALGRLRAFADRFIFSEVAAMAGGLTAVAEGLAAAEDCNEAITLFLKIKERTCFWGNSKSDATR